MKKPRQKNVLLIVTGVAFAQFPDGLSIGAWGRADFVPVQGVFVNKNNVDPVFLSGVGAGWKAAYWGFDLKYSALDGRVGGTISVGPGEGGNTNVGIGDNLNIWTKPFGGSDILYLVVGKIVDGRFRGLGSVDDDFHGWVGGFGDNGDPVFTRFNDGGGALFISQPITGLSVFAHIKPGVGTVSTQRPLSTKIEAGDVYKKIQAGFAYDISGIGLARAQWYGNSMDFTPGKLQYKFDLDSGVVADPIKDAWNPARIEAAFRLTAVENLNLDLGVKLPIPIKRDIGPYEETYQDNFRLNIIGDYTAGDFKIAYNVFVAFGGSLADDSPSSTRSDLASSFTAMVIPSFYVTAIDATVGANVGFKVEGDDETIPGDIEKGFTFGFGGWISRNLGKGKIKTGLAYQFPKYGENSTIGAASYLSWPIILELSF